MDQTLSIPVRATGRTQRLFNNARGEGQLSDVLDCRFYNAVAFQVYVSGTGPSATLTVQAGPEQAGPFLTLFDPYAVRRNLDSDISFDVVSGMPWLRLQLSDISGSFGNNQGFTVIGVPYTAAANPQLSRPQWYDREPSVQVKSYVALLAPHASTVRWSYTVPAGKKAYFDVTQIQIQRATAAGAAGNVEVQVSFTPAGGSAAPILDILFGDNTPAAVGREVVAQLGAFNAGDKLEGVTSDTSTGGTARYHLTAKYIEFDG